MVLAVSRATGLGSHAHAMGLIVGRKRVKGTTNGRLIFLVVPVQIK
jgi:hypothetical protein